MCDCSLSTCLTSRWLSQTFVPSHITSNETVYRRPLSASLLITTIYNATSISQPAITSRSAANVRYIFMSCRYFTQLNKKKILKQRINDILSIYTSTLNNKQHLTHSFVIISVNRKLIFHWRCRSNRDGQLNSIRYDTIQWTILMCAQTQKLTSKKLHCWYQLNKPPRKMVHKRKEAQRA